MKELELAFTLLNLGLPSEGGAMIDFSIRFMRPAVSSSTGCVYFDILNIRNGIRTAGKGT